MPGQTGKTSSAFHWQEDAPEALGMSHSGLEHYTQWLHTRAEGEAYGTVAVRYPLSPTGAASSRWTRFGRGLC